MAGIETSLIALSAVDYQLRVRIPRVEVASRILGELEARRAASRKNPTRKASLVDVRKQFGKQIADLVTRALVLEAFEAEVDARPDLAPFGEPRVVERRYAFDGDGDLDAVVQFAVMPEIELAQNLGPITRFVRRFGADEIDAEIERLRAEQVRMEKLPGDVSATARDVARVDIQPVDDGGVPLGPVQREGEIHLADPRLPRALIDALTGRCAADEVTVEVPRPGGDGFDRYHIFIREVRRQVLPVLDEAFVLAHTQGVHSDLRRFREELRESLEQSWQRRAEQQLRRRMVDRFVGSHAFEVPETLVEARLDDLAAEEMRRRKDKDSFDEEAFRQQHRQQAREDVRWRLLRERLIAEEAIEATESDFEEEYKCFVGGTATVDSIRDDFARQPRLRQRIAAQIVERRVAEALARRFEIVEKSRDELLARINSAS